MMSYLFLKPDLFIRISFVILAAIPSNTQKADTRPCISYIR